MEIRLNILFISLLIGFAYPCSCIEPPPPEEAYEDADLVFSGLVTNIVLDASGYYYEVTFQIIDIWKGEYLEEITVLTELFSDTCGYPFQINNEYLVYAYTYSWGIYTNICTRTNLLEYASEDLDYLNQLPICDNGYSEIDDYCFYEDDIAALQAFIDNSLVSDWQENNDCYPGDYSCGSPNPYMDEYSSVSVNGEEFNTLSSINNGIVEPLELGYQGWVNGRLTSLMCGAFIYCGLSGEIPENISDLTEIEVLRLEVNYFDGEIPESVCDLENVDFNDYLSFDLSYNQLCPPYPDCVPDDAVEYMDTSECWLSGDFNLDNTVNILDIIILVNHILSPATVELEGADLNDDGEINILDIVILVNIILDTADTSTVTDIDGNIYETVQIGNQLWMAENLKVTHYQNSDEIPYIYNDPQHGAYTNYSNNAENLAVYGRLYNWFGVNDERGLCPDNWHIPSDDEFKSLEMYLGMSESEANG